MNVLLNQDQAVVQWMGEEMGHHFEAPRAIAAVDDSGLPLGAVAFHNFTGRDIVISAVASDKHWLTRSMLKVLAMYVFDQLGCVRVTAIVAKSNKHTRKIMERLGFKVEGHMRQMVRDTEPAIIYGLLKNEWRFGGLNHART
jgi:RimJ/RimL family protein N-acetyltransferase